MGVDVLIDFMMSLVGDVSHKVILILGNLRVHHAKHLKVVWLVKNKKMMQVFYQPVLLCSLELNQDEYLSCDLKTEACCAEPCVIKNIKGKAFEYLQMSQAKGLRAQKIISIRKN